MHVAVKLQSMHAAILHAGRSSALLDVLPVVLSVVLCENWSTFQYKSCYVGNLQHAAL